jgi:regulator of replication initiation timing
MRDPSAFFAYTKLLERDLARADHEKQRLIQTNKDLLRSLNGRKEAKFEQAALLHKDAELEEARRLRLEAHQLIKAASAKQAQQLSELDSKQQQLDQKETELKQQTCTAAAAVSETVDARRQLKAQAQLIQQVQSENVQLREEKTEESELSVRLTRDKPQLQEKLDELKQTDRAIDGLRQFIAQLTEEIRQLQQDKEQLQQQLDERTAELSTAESQIADAVSLAQRIVAIQQARPAVAGVDAHSPAQLATKPIVGKRKSGEALESEEKKRQRGVESGPTALPEQKNGVDDKCVICLDKPPDVLFQRCQHLVCCNVCAASLLSGAAAGAVCPQCHTRRSVPKMSPRRILVQDATSSIRSLHELDVMLFFPFTSLLMHRSSTLHLPGPCAPFAEAHCASASACALPASVLRLLFFASLQPASCPASSPSSELPLRRLACSS